METVELQNNRKRLDLVIQEQRPDLSRSLIQSWIKQGMVMIAGKVITKPGLLVSSDVEFTLQLHAPEFVSRSGAKLAQALQEFAIDVTGLTALDIGLSTGGFTDCLLQNGIAKVFGVDVGTGQVHPKISGDDRVVVMEQTDIRNCIGKLPKVDIITVDVSFISVTKFLHVIEHVMQPSGMVIILVKPQFEGTQKDLARGGIVKNAVLRKQILQNVVAALLHAGFDLQGCVESITIGGDGNIEYLAYFKKN